MIEVDKLLLQDTHVHSTFSDGASTLAENVAEAERIGLQSLTCVDHVRPDTAWIPSYAAAVGEMRGATAVELQCAVEAKLLDTSGALDLPADLPESISSTPRITRCRCRAAPGPPRRSGRRSRAASSIRWS